MTPFWLSSVFYLWRRAPEPLRRMSEAFPVIAAGQSRRWSRYVQRGEVFRFKLPKGVGNEI
jgi:hypothetical protein